VNRYAAALIAIAIDLVAALSTISGPITVAGAVQLALLIIGSVGVYLLPLLGQYAAGAKIAAAVITAALTALAPLLVDGTITGPQLALVALAALKVLGAKVGVELRKDDVARAA
jgi:hypothetical protein